MWERQTNEDRWKLLPHLLLRCLLEADAGGHVTAHSHLRYQQKNAHRGNKQYLNILSRILLSDLSTAAAMSTEDHAPLLPSPRSVNIQPPYQMQRGSLGIQFSSHGVLVAVRLCLKSIT